MRKYLYVLLAIILYPVSAFAEDTSASATPPMCAVMQDCSGADAQRLQGAYDSMQTTPEQRSKLRNFIKKNTNHGTTNWGDASRDYFSWRQETIAPESYSDFKRRIDSLSFNAMTSLDSSAFDRKKLKYFDEVKARRTNAVNYAYNATYCSQETSYEVAKCTSPIGLISAKLCSGRDHCYVLMNRTFSNACPPSVGMTRSIVMAMGSVPQDAEPCNFRSASVGYGGPPILVEKTAFDSHVREKTITNAYGYLGSGGQKPITQEKKYYIEIEESYAIAVPIDYFLNIGAASGSSSSGVTIRLSGSYDSSISVGADEIYGFSKKIRELKPSFMQ